MAQQEDDAAKVASMAYFRALRMEQMKRTGNGDPVPIWIDIRPIDQAIFLRCMRVALSAAKPENVQRVMEHLNKAS